MEKISLLYQKRGYMDRYGIHVWITLITLILFFLANGYYYVINNMKLLDNNWDEVRCNPIVMPFAGMIHSEEGVSPSEYTQQNFESCMNDTMRPIAKVSFKPFKTMGRVLLDDLKQVGRSATDLKIEIKNKEDDAEEEETSFKDEIGNKMNSTYILLHKFKQIGLQLNGIMYLILNEAFGVFNTTTSIIKNIVKIVLGLPGGKEILNQKL